MSEFHKIAVPATRSSSPMLAIRRRVVVALMVGCMVSGLLGLGFALSALRGSNAPAAAAAPTAAVALAEEAGRDFLASRNSTAPAADQVRTDWATTPDGAPAEAAFTVTSFSFSGHTSYRIGDTDDQLVHLIRFRVVADARAYNLDVPVTETAYGPVLAGAPALLPARTGSKRAPAADYANYESVDNVDPDVEVSLADWVTYYARDGVGSKDLKTLTGDQRQNTRYDGLGGWTGELRQVVSAVPVGGGESGLPAGQIVQIDVVLTPPAANGPSLSTTYDLYVVTEGNPARPPVVAWGPAGSVEELTPYLNAN